MSHTVTDKTDGKAITPEEFNQQARRWASIVRNTARRRALSFNKGKKSPTHRYKTGKKAGKVEKKLAASIRYKIEHNDRIPESIGFLIPIHGIWREWAVGYGQPRVPGKYVNPHPRIRRTIADWLDEPIDRNTEKLFDLAAEFWGDEFLVNVFGGKENRF